MIVTSKEFFSESMHKFPLQALLRAKGLKLSVSCLVVAFAMFNFPSSKTWLQGARKVGEARQSRNEPDIFSLTHRVGNELVITCPSLLPTAAIHFPSPE